MRDIELEEGEAYFLEEDDDDDDENIDPDRDFSYIDKKIENLLGHYQKDFMGGLSAETLGARHGGYGSFLPMQQRSPRIPSNPTANSHISSKSPQNPSLERFHPNPSTAVNHSLVRSEPGMSLPKKQSNLQNSREGSFNDHQKKPLMHNPELSLLKFRVKMTSEKKYSHDNSALYSGLGLDMSPSSPDDSPPAEYDRTSPDIQEREEESPSCIVKIMTLPPLSNDALLSPLDGRLISLMGMENNVESGLPESTQVLPDNILHVSTFSEAKAETSKESKSKLKNRSKEKKSKEKESRKDKESKRQVQSANAEDLVKENQGFSLDAVTLSAHRKEASKILLAETVVPKTSVNASDALSELMELATLTGSSTGSKASVMVDKKNEVGRLEHVPNKEGLAKVRDKSKGELVLLPSQDVGMGGEGNANTLRGKIDQKVISNPRKEVGCKEGEAPKFPKQQGVAKEKVKAVVLNSAFPKEDVHRNENVFRDGIPKDTEVNFVSKKIFSEIDKKIVVSQERKGRNVETIESSKKKSHSKTTPNSHIRVGKLNGKDHSSAVVKNKSKESHTDGVYPAALPTESLIAGSGYSAMENEVISRSNISSKSKKGIIDLSKEVRRDINLASNAHPSRKGNEMHSKDIVMRVSQSETRAFNERMEKSSVKRPEIASNVGSNMVGDQSGGTSSMEKAPAIVGVLPTENAMSMVMDDWVQCEDCDTWRLLPFGKNPNLLPKEWVCEMLDWLPGMNKCSVSEDETTSALKAMYQLQVPDSLIPNNQQVHPVGSAPLSDSPAPLPTRATSIDAMPGGGSKRNLVRMEKNAARQNGFQGPDISVKKDQYFGESRKPKNPKKLPRESDVIPKNGEIKSSQGAKKRVADFEASGVAKKMKRHPMENPDRVGMLTVKAKGEGSTYNHGALPFSEDFAEGTPGFPLLKGKDRTQNAMVARVHEKEDISGKKRKLKDQWKSVIPTEELSAKATVSKISDTELRNDKKEKRSKASSFQAKEGSANKGRGRTQSDNSPNRIRMNDMHPEKKYHADSEFQRTVRRKSSERAHDLGLENATTSSSSKISCKVKAKKSDAKCSPVGSISSSRIRVPKADLDKSVNKTSVLYDEAEELLSAKQLKSRGEGPSNGCTHNEEARVRKSNLSITSGRSGNMFATSDDDNSAKKIRGKSHVSGTIIKKEPTSHILPKLEEGRVDKVTLRNPHAPRNVARDIGASSSITESFYKAAKTALKEATELKHSANHLKKSGSGLESTMVFFQAALKFLEGGSLLEPENSESGRCAEMSPSDVYSSTAGLCEYCAREYERYNDMAHAALAYKCMEVAYMRVVYYNDLSASRDRMELRMAAIDAPQAESPSSSASDVDNLNNQTAMDTAKNGDSATEHQNHVISAENRPNFVRLLDFTKDINLAMEASRRSQSAFATANPVLMQARNDEGISCIKRLLDFSFHDVDGLLCLVRLALKTLNN